jgi:cyclopropane fatty-acyl-phospholipid synthase-like methyltransferase
MTTSFRNTLDGSEATGGALTAPAAARNRDPILAVLREVLPATGTVLEIAAGTGEHAVHFAAALPRLFWQPTDPDEHARASIAAHAAAAGLANMLPALALDASAAVWPVGHADAIVSINMIHIAPWHATEGLMAGAARLLPRGAPLYLYGPYRVHGEHTVPSNAAFDESLRARDPAWGVRDLDEVVALAAGHGHRLERTVAMPANNLSVVFRRNP